jgi:ubiquitin C-terminal hydrolase
VPQVLCVHLKRLGFGHDGRLHKHAGPVTFPLMVNVGALCWPERAGAAALVAPRASSARPPPRPVLLQLVAVVEHLGGATSGHFVTYRRRRRGDAGPWVRVSDSDVTAVDAAAVLGCEAYMLLYARRRM